MPLGNEKSELFSFEVCLNFAQYFQATDNTEGSSFILCFNLLLGLIQLPNFWWEPDFLKVKMTRQTLSCLTVLYHPP